MRRGESEREPTNGWWEEESLALLNHDLRNALASIVSALQILRLQGYVNPLAEQAGRTIERQADQLNHLADHLSELAGVPRPAPTPAPVARKLQPIGDQAEEIVPQRILVVDDNRDAADSTGTLLLLWGHRVRVAYDGASAVVAALDFRPDLCLVDIGMPVMNGYEVAQRLRSEPSLRGVRLVAMTGFDQETDRERSTEAGFDAHLVKPVEIGALQDLLTTDTGAAKRAEAAVVHERVG